MSWGPSGSRSAFSLSIPARRSPSRSTAGCLLHRYRLRRREHRSARGASILLHESFWPGDTTDDLSHTAAGAGRLAAEAAVERLVLVHINPEGCDDDGRCHFGQSSLAASEVGRDGRASVQGDDEQEAGRVGRGRRWTACTALFDAGAGRIGEYEHCSWYAAGTGTYLGGERSSPTIGEARRSSAFPSSVSRPSIPRSGTTTSSPLCAPRIPTRSRRSTSTRCCEGDALDGRGCAGTPARRRMAMLEAEDGTVLCHRTARRSAPRRTTSPRPTALIAGLEKAAELVDELEVVRIRAPRQADAPRVQGQEREPSRPVRASLGLGRSPRLGAIHSGPARAQRARRSARERSAGRQSLEHGDRRSRRAWQAGLYLLLSESSHPRALLLARHASNGLSQTERFAHCGGPMRPKGERGSGQQHTGGRSRRFRFLRHCRSPQASRMP